MACLICNARNARAKIQCIFVFTSVEIYGLTFQTLLESIRISQISYACFGKSPFIDFSKN